MKNIFYVACLAFCSVVIASSDTTNSTSIESIDSSEAAVPVVTNDPPSSVPTIALTKKKRNAPYCQRGGSRYRLKAVKPSSKSTNKTVTPRLPKKSKSRPPSRKLKR